MLHTCPFICLMRWTDKCWRWHLMLPGSLTEHFRISGVRSNRQILVSHTSFIIKINMYISMNVLVHTFELEELYFALYLCDKYEPSPHCKFRPGGVQLFLFRFANKFSKTTTTTTTENSKIKQKRNTMNFLLVLNNRVVWIKFPPYAFL